MKNYYIAYADLFIELIADESLVGFLSAAFSYNLLDVEPPTLTKIDTLQLQHTDDEWQLISGDQTLSIEENQLAKILIKKIERCFIQKYDKHVILKAGAIYLKNAAIIVPTIKTKEIRSFCQHINTGDQIIESPIMVAFSENGEYFDGLNSSDNDTLQLTSTDELNDISSENCISPDDSKSRFERFQSNGQPKLFIFPNHINDGDFNIEPLTQGQTLLELTGCVLNGEILPATGFKHLSNLSRNIPAIKVNYKELKQIGSYFTELLTLITGQGILPEQLHHTFKRLSYGTELNDEDIVSDSEKQAADSTPQATPTTDAHLNKKLTIAMATYDDYDGVYFSVQSLRMFHPEVCDDLEIIILDNNPTGKCADALINLSNHVSNLRYIPELGRSGTAVRDLVFTEANSEYVLCMDCHVMIEPGAIAKLIDYYQANPDCADLLQGPMMNDNLKGLSTHFTPKWNQGMYGVWGFDKRAQDPEAEPFDIPMQGLGLFTCKKSAWPGFNSNFRGFGGEEGYIHEKIRQAGGRTLCLPFLRWLHRFARPLGVPYSVNWKDRVINYLIGFTELGLDVTEVKDHFTELLSQKTVEECVREVERLQIQDK